MKRKITPVISKKMEKVHELLDKAAPYLNEAEQLMRPYLEMEARENDKFDDVVLLAINTVDAYEHVRDRFEYWPQ